MRASSKPRAGGCARTAADFGRACVIDRIEDSNGELIGLAKITRDITERREAQQRLEAAREQLYQSQKMDAVGQLTGGVAHDFNNLLTIIIGNLDNAKRTLAKWQDGAQARLARAIDHALVGAERAATLTGHLLAFSRRQPLEPKLLDVNRLLTQLSVFLKPTLGEAVQLEIVGAGGVWQVEADAAQLETAILNLAVNARDAMPDGGKLTIEAANVLLDEDYCAKNAEVKPGQYVQISVTDNGAGMAKEVLALPSSRSSPPKKPARAPGLGSARSMVSSSNRAATSKSTASPVKARPCISICRALTANPPRLTCKMPAPHRRPTARKPFWWSRTTVTCAPSFAKPCST